jgi:hypothetical protein
VELLDPAAVGTEQVHRVGRAAPGPVDVQLQVHQPRVRRGREDVVGAPAGAVVDGEELVVVVVVAEGEAGLACEGTGLVEVEGEVAPHGGVVDRTVRVDAEERVHDGPAAEGPGDGEGLLPRGGVERLRYPEVPGGRPDAVGVEQGAELGGGQPGGAGGLDAAVADVAQGRQGSGGVRGEDVADGEELDADLVDGYAAAGAVAGCARGGGGGGGEGTGADRARDGGSGGGGAEESAAA